MCTYLHDAYDAHGPSDAMICIKVQMIITHMEDGTYTRTCTCNNYTHCTNANCLKYCYTLSILQQAKGNRDE